MYLMITTRNRCGSSRMENTDRTASVNYRVRLKLFVLAVLPSCSSDRRLGMLWVWV